MASPDRYGEAWDSSVLFGAQTGPGTFYRVMPHNTMAFIFGVAFLYAFIAMTMGVRIFWRGLADATEARPSAPRSRVGSRAS